jgi:hypothetical protein
VLLLAFGAHRKGFMNPPAQSAAREVSVRQTCGDIEFNFIRERSMTLEHLTCKAECEAAVLRLFAGIDNHDRELWASAFTDNATQGAPGRESSPAHATWALLPENFRPVHIITNMMVTPTGANSADGIALTTAYHIYTTPNDPPVRPMPETPSGVGKIGFGFTKTAAGWRINELRLMLPIFDDGGPTNVEYPERPRRP